MTVQQIILHMLSYIGIRNLDPDENTTDAHPGISSGGTGAYGDIEFALNKLNMAMQFVFREGPGSLSERPGGTILKAPRNISMSVTKYSQTVAITGWEADMVGCSVRMSGDEAGENTLLSSTLLRRPYPGATGTIQGTVYHDAVLLAEDVRTIIEPIELPDRNPQLSVVTSQRELDTFNSGYLGTDRQSAQPRAAFISAIRLTAAPQKMIKFNPMPDMDYPVRWYEKINPPSYTLADVIASGDRAEGPFTDPGTVLPLHWTESVLLPIATELFTSHPSFSNPAALKAIEKEAAIARTLMLPDEIVSRSPAKSHKRNTIPCLH